MSPTNPVQAVGYYCGRFGPGLLGEPQNSFSNLAFLAGAALAWHIWRSSSIRDTWQPVLFALVASIGVGSFIFHSHPTRETLLIDLAPIQVFGLAALAYVCIRYLKISLLGTIALMLGFFVIRQYWIAVAPRGALGGAITHVPALVALFTVGLLLAFKRILLARYVFGACGAYIAAILVRSWDLYLCPSFPYGLHWLWHMLTAITASLVVVGMAKYPPTARARDAA
jgi:hypothetical protein